MPKNRTKALSETEFEKIYSLFWKRLYGLGYNYLRNKTTAKELVQEVFVKLWLKRNELSNIQDIEAYLFECLKNGIYDRYHTAGTEQNAIPQSSENTNDEESQPAGEGIDYQEILGMIKQQPRKLPAKTRAMFG